MSGPYSHEYGSGAYAPRPYDANRYDTPTARPQPAQQPSYYSGTGSNPVYDTPSAASSAGYMNPSAPPAYSSTQHLVDPEAQQQAQAHSGQWPQSRSNYPPNTHAHQYGPGPSPFESVFDDHMYPATSYGGAAGVAGGNTAYYGGRRSPSDDNVPGVVSDGIPLRDRTAANKLGGAESPDHVYDIPQGAAGAAAAADGAGGRGRGRKGRVRFGELGMMGANRKRIPYVVYLLTTIQIAVFIAEIVKNGLVTGSPIMIHPSFNPMIGPSTYVMINMGSRFVPCMHNVQGIQSSTTLINWPCPNTTTNDATSSMNMCTLSELCGFSGVPNPLYDGNANQKPEPNQWFRFIIPMFMHSGLIHIGFNMLLQLTIGRDMERSIGAIRFFIVYISSGIFGFVMGGNYAGLGISSTGASGSLFGIIALTLLDLLYSWRDRRHPVKDLLFIILDVVISFVLGLLPGLDNFSHIGGFLMGLALGISVLHSPNALRRRIGEDSSYATVSAASEPDNLKAMSFFRNPVGFFKGRKPLWWGWWLLRVGAIVLVVVVFIVLLNNFYIYHNTCSWCKYLSCLVSLFPHSLRFLCFL